jgi:multicomponent Na+:H+ antiporter subunit D
MIFKILSSSYHIASLVFLSPIPLLIPYKISKYNQKIGNFFFFINSLLPISFFCYILKISQNKTITIAQTLNITTNINIELATSQIGHIFTFIITSLLPIVTIYSIAYFSSNYEKKPQRFQALTYLSIILGIGLAYSNNLFTAFIFYEMITISTFFLIAQTKGVQVTEVSSKYIILLMTPSMLLLLPAIVTIYNATYTITFSPEGIINKIPFSQQTINILFAMCLFGVAKTTILPMYRWIVEAMIAPAPVSAILHAVLVVKSGIIMMYKISHEIFGMQVLQENLYSFYNIQWPYIIIIATILFASIVAIDTDNLKKRLAYSTISNINYILLVILTNASTKTELILYIIASHSFSKITLFFYVGYLYSRYNITHIEQLYNNNIKNNKIVALATITSIFNLIGTPFTLGYNMKHEFISFVQESNINPSFIFAVFFSSISTIIYTSPLLKTLLSNVKRYVNYDYITSNEKKISKTNHILFIVSIAAPNIVLILITLFYFKLLKLA